MPLCQSLELAEKISNNHQVLNSPWNFAISCVAMLAGMVDGGSGRMG